jgi:hypothetical protein
MNRIVHFKDSLSGRYIGRPKAGDEWGFGNPFVIGKDGDRPTVIAKFVSWLDERKTFGNKDATPERRQWILNHLHELKDQDLICWCNYPQEDCHGRILIEKSNNIKKTLAIIGTAGRGKDYQKLNSQIYNSMISAAKKVIELESVTHLVSGGAAWADSVTHELHLPKRIYLPSDPKNLATAEYYHKKFWSKVTYATTAEEAEDAEIISGGGFLDRNLLVAKEADIFLAMTFGEKNEVKDGGTKHTVNAMLRQGKSGYHLDLNTLKLYKDAK